MVSLLENQKIKYWIFVISLSFVATLFPAYSYAQTIDPFDYLNAKLSKKPDIEYVGRWNGTACALTGMITKGPPFAYSLAGSIKPEDISFNNERSVGEPRPKILSRRAVSNCNDTPARLTRTFNESYSKTVSMTNSKTISRSLSVNATFSFNLFESIGSRVGVTDTHTWSATESSTQSTTQSYGLADSVLVEVPPKKRVVVSFYILETKYVMDYHAKVKFEGSIYPCSGGRNKAISGYLPAGDLYIDLLGELSFAEGNTGEFFISTPENASCEGTDGLIDEPAATSP